MKSEVKYVLVSAGVLLAGVVMTASGVYSANSQRDEFLEQPLISDEAGLEAALAGEKQLYCLTNMRISGTPAEDPMGILDGEYVYIAYEKATCKEEVSKNGETTYTWEGSSDDVIAPSYSSEMLLFDKYPVTTVEYAPIMDGDTGTMVGTITADQVKAEYQELTDEYYYPEEMGDKDGNVRYSVTVIPMDQEAAMYATVGDGEIVMEYNDDMFSYVIMNGTMEHMATYFRGDGGMMRILLGIMIIIPLGILLLLITIVFGITSMITKKKKPQTKTAQKSLAQRSQMTKNLSQKNPTSKKQ